MVKVCVAAESTFEIVSRSPWCTERVEGVNTRFPPWPCSTVCPPVAADELADCAGDDGDFVPPPQATATTARHAATAIDAFAHRFIRSRSISSSALPSLQGYGRRAQQARRFIDPLRARPASV